MFESIVVDQLRKPLKRIFSSFQHIEVARNLLPAAVFGVSLGLFVHGYWLIDVFPFGGRSLLFATILISLMGMAGYVLLFSWIKKASSDFPNFQKAGIAGAGLLVGAFLFFTVTDRWQEPARYVSLFLPAHTLEISVSPDQNADGVSILWINTSLGDVSYDTIEYDGWILKNDRLVLTDFSDNHLRWVGKTGKDVQLVFETSLRNGNAVISWDGQAEILQFSKKKNSHVHTFDIPFHASPNFTFLLGILNFALLSLPLCIVIWMKRTEILKSVLHGFTPTLQQINRREWMVVLALIALALAFRVPGLENLFPGVEEYSHINAAKQMIRGASIRDVYQRSMWLVTFPVSLMFRIFGYKLWAARLLGVIFNVLAIVPLYLIARRINRPVAILSALLFATSPWIIAISRFVREYAYYPFFYFWILYGMILFLEGIPDRFHLDRDWKIVLKPKMLFLGLGLAFPVFYALSVDHLSTFKLILIGYGVFGFFIFLKVDLAYRKNLIVILVMASAVLVSAYLLRGYFSVRTTVNLVPLNYFFLNSPQQWYFDRVAVVPLIGLLGAVAVSVLLWRVNGIPLLLVILYGGFLGFFMLSTNKFFASRHLSTTQLWYVILMAIGCYLIWVFLQTFSFFGDRRIRFVTVIVLCGLVINTRQLFLPMTSRDPYMPITEDYHNDLTELQEFMLANVEGGDVLISSRIYSRYIYWVDEPIFREIYDFQVNSTITDVLSVVDQYDSGWIIIDNARIERAVFSPADVFLDDNRIEYIGLFDDEHVWRWTKK